MARACGALASGSQSSSPAILCHSWCPEGSTPAWPITGRTSRRNTQPGDVSHRGRPQERVSRQARSTLSAKASEMGSDQEPEEDRRCAGTCRGSSAPVRSTERLRWIDGKRNPDPSTREAPGLLRVADEALGREARQFVGSDRDSAGQSLSWPLGMRPGTERQTDLDRRSPREARGF